MSRTAKQRPPRTATYRPAQRHRKFRHDDRIAVDLFSGFGGLTQGIEEAGFQTIAAANHNPFKVEVHEANYPHAEHWIADLVDSESPDYHDVRDLPAGDFLVAGVSCVNHSQANTVKAYAEGLTLFDLPDPEWEARVTRSERDRATASCVLHYAQRHHPMLILVECTTQLASWGPAVPGKRKVGDGSTFRWWLQQFGTEGYLHKILYLNSMFFGVPQSRDRLYIALWDRRVPAPDLEHRPPSWCGRCEQVVEGVWTWRTGIPPTGKVCYGEQYCYRCPRCRAEVFPPRAPSLAALDLSNLGTRIGDRTTPLAASTMARAERCRQRFTEFPVVLLPGSAPMAGFVTVAHRHNGDGKHLLQPMDTVTGTDEKSVLLAWPGSDGQPAGLDPMAVAVDNWQGAARGVGEPLPTQAGSQTMGLVTARVLPNRTHGTSRGLTEPMETVVASAGSGGLGLLSTGVFPGMVTAAGTIKHNGPIGEAKYRAHPVSDPLGTVVGSGNHQALLFSGWYKQNGSVGTETAPHPLSDPLGTLTARDTTALLSADWAAALADLRLEDCYYRMMAPHEVGRGCGFDVTFGGHQGTFVVWGSARDQVDGFGNAVSPAVGTWIGSRLRASLHTPEAFA